MILYKIILIIGLLLGVGCYVSSTVFPIPTPMPTVIASPTPTPIPSVIHCSQLVCNGDGCHCSGSTITCKDYSCGINECACWTK